MPRGYRCIVLATLGWLILAASPAQQEGAGAHKAGAQPNAEQSLRDIAAALNKPEKAPEPDRGCEQGKDNRKSDLCAQWKAADAAKDAADWTGLMYPWVVAGTIIGGLTLLAAVAAACYAALAYQEGKRSADAGEEAVKATQRAQRPYVMAVDPVISVVRKPNGIFPQVEFGMKNYGSAPVFIERVKYELNGTCEDNIRMKCDVRSFGAYTANKAVPFSIVDSGNKITEEIVASHFNEGSIFFLELVVSIIYRDIFGIIRSTGSGFVWHGCHGGNERVMTPSANSAHWHDHEIESAHPDQPPPAMREPWWLALMPVFARRN